MKAMNDRVIARVGYMPESTGGIILAATTMTDGQMKLNIGKVLAVGPGLTLRSGEFIPVGVKEGDIITWEQYGGIQYEVLGKNIVCIRSEDVGVILDRPDEYSHYLFTDEEIEAYRKQEQDKMEEIKRKQLEAAASFAKTAKHYICVNNRCVGVKKMRKFLYSEDKACEYCGVEMDVVVAE